MNSSEVLITERRTKIDFAQSLKHLVELYPQADVIRVVQDNLNTHKMGSLYDAFPQQEARTIASKLEFHTTPKHGSWLNIAAIEWAVLANMCPDRILDEETLRKHVETNVKERKTKAEPVKWRFNTQDARRKWARLYPSVST
jgi:DDE superfamily endonuclease